MENDNKKINTQEIEKTKIENQQTSTQHNFLDDLRIRHNRIRDRIIHHKGLTRRR